MINENLFFDFSNICMLSIDCLLSSLFYNRKQKKIAKKFYDYPLKSKLDNTLQQHPKMRRPLLLQVRIF